MTTMNERIERARKAADMHVIDAKHEAGETVYQMTRSDGYAKAYIEILVAEETVVRVVSP